VPSVTEGRESIRAGSPDCAEKAHSHGQTSKPGRTSVRIALSSRLARRCSGDCNQDPSGQRGTSRDASGHCTSERSRPASSSPCSSN
jgi:hypothetical protein